MLALRLLSEGVEGPNTGLQWFLLVGIAFFLLTIIVGWWASSRKQEQVEAGHEAKRSAKKDADQLIKIDLWLQGYWCTFLQPGGEFLF